MKRIILSIAMVAMFTIIGNAQENTNVMVNTNTKSNETDSRGKPNIGFKGGVNYSNVFDVKADEFNADPKFGFVGGLFLAIPIGKFLGVQPEVLYSQKGFKASGRVLGQAYDFRRTTSFIDFPLLFTVKPSEGITLLAGPQYSFLFHQRDEFGNDDLVLDTEDQFNNDNIRKNILCFIGGIDINLDQLVLGARVGWDITKNNGDGTSTSPQYRNVWYQATIGFRFSY
jgi:hypothetical protein